MYTHVPIFWCEARACSLHMDPLIRVTPLLSYINHILHLPSPVFLSLKGGRMWTHLLKNLNAGTPHFYKHPATVHTVLLVSCPYLTSSTPFTANNLASFAKPSAQFSEKPENLFFFTAHLTEGLCTGHICVLKLAIWVAGMGCGTS